jgi:hypothetical protein
MNAEKKGPEAETVEDANRQYSVGRPFQFGIGHLLLFVTLWAVFLATSRALFLFASPGVFVLWVLAAGGPLFTMLMVGLARIVFDSLASKTAVRDGRSPRQLIGLSTKEAIAVALALPTTLATAAFALACWTSTLPVISDASLANAFRTWSQVLNFTFAAWLYSFGFFALICYFLWLFGRSRVLPRNTTTDRPQTPPAADSYGG